MGFLSCFINRWFSESTSSRNRLFSSFNLLFAVSFLSIKQRSSTQCCHSLSEEKKYKKKYKKKYLKKKKYKKKYFSGKKNSARAYGARIKKHFNVPHFTLNHTFLCFSVKMSPVKTAPVQMAQKLAT